MWPLQSCLTLTVYIYIYIFMFKQQDLWAKDPTLHAMKMTWQSSRRLTCQGHEWLTRAVADVIADPGLRYSRIFATEFPLPGCEPAAPLPPLTACICPTGDVSTVSYTFAPGCPRWPLAVHWEREGQLGFLHLHSTPRSSTIQGQI